jgi:hypothetical protein
MNSQNFTPSYTFNVWGKLYIAYNERVETLLANGTINDTSRILELTKSGALIALIK